MTIFKNKIAPIIGAILIACLSACGVKGDVSLKTPTTDSNKKGNKQ